MEAKRAREARVEKLREAMLDELERAARAADEIVITTQEGGIIRG